MLNFIKSISPTELIIFGVIAVIFFGTKTITRLGRTGGETLREMKNIKKSITDVFEDDEPQHHKKGVSK